MSSKNIYSDDFEEDDYFINDKNNHNDKNLAVNTTFEKDSKSELNTIVDVSINNTKNNLIVYLNCVTIKNGKGQYGTRTYILSTKRGTLGLFDLLDDFFLHRFKFFYSSKSVQAFMCALAIAEKKFKEKTNFTFFEYCAKINKMTIDKMNKVKDSRNDLNCKIWSGYGIRDEAMLCIETKREYINFEYIEEVGINVIKLFIKYMEYINKKHFVGISVNKIEDAPSSLCVDPFVDLPMIMYIPEFAEILMSKISHSFMETDEFKKMGINQIIFEIYLLMPNTTVNDMKNFATRDGEIKNYDTIEDEIFIIGKYKNYIYKNDEIDIENFDSIICYS